MALSKPQGTFFIPCKVRQEDALSLIAALPLAPPAQRAELNQGRGEFLQGTS